MGSLSHKRLAKEKNPKIVYVDDETTVVSPRLQTKTKKKLKKSKKELKPNQFSFSKGSRGLLNSRKELTDIKNLKKKVEK